MRSGKWPADFLSLRAICAKKSPGRTYAQVRPAGRRVRLLKASVRRRFLHYSIPYCKSFNTACCAWLACWRADIPVD